MSKQHGVETLQNNETHKLGICTCR